MNTLSDRTPGEVFDDHLRLSQDRAFAEDIIRNFDPECVVLTGRGIFHGHPGLRELARMLEEDMPSGRWDYRMWLVAGNAAFLEWGVDSGERVVDDGVDSFFIVDGKVVVQTIHYTVRAPDGRVLIGPDGKHSK